MNSWRVGVVGCGTAGAAAALFLARAGHQVTVLERVADPHPLGAGITLQPTGQAVLARLGLLAPIAARAAPIDRLWVRRLGGKTVVDLRYRDVDATMFGLGLHRGVLFETLLDAVRGEPGVTLRLGVDVASWSLDGATRWLHSSDGERHGPYDLVVAAAGGACALDAHTSVRRTVRPYPWGALWFVAKDPDRVFDRDITQWVDGPRHMCGLLPTGQAPRGRGDTPVASLFWSIRADRVPSWRAAGLAAWKADVRRFEPRAGFIVDQIDSIDQVLFTQYRDVDMRRWHEPGAVFLGDAAHATSPQLGQGANLALWDAMVLGDCCAASPSVAEALAAYTKARRRHLDYYQLATRLLTPFFQSDSRVLGWLRDLVFPMSRWFHPLRRRMVRTMCGIDRGIVRRAMGARELQHRLPP